mgnify:CR=1 FL=1
MKPANVPNHNASLQEIEKEGFSLSEAIASQVQVNKLIKDVSFMKEVLSTIQQYVEKHHVAISQDLVD